MGIDSGGQPLGPNFPRQIVRKSATQGFRRPAPYDPLLGHNLPLLPLPEVVRVAVSFLTDDESGFLYECSIVDTDGVLTEETIDVYHLTDPDLGVVLEEGSLALAHLIDGKYWMQSGEGTALREVDFVVDLFDRYDSDDLGTHWDNSGNYAIRDGRAYSAGSVNYNFSTYANLHRITSLADTSQTGLVNLPSGSFVHPRIEDQAAQAIAYGLFQAMGSADSISDVIYRAKLSSGDSNYRIIFNASRYATHPSGNALGSIQFCTHIPPDNQTRGTRISIAAGLLPQLSTDASNASWGVTIASGVNAGVYSATATSPATTLAENQFLRIGMAVNDNTASRNIVLATPNTVISNLDANSSGPSSGAFAYHATTQQTVDYLDSQTTGVQDGLNELYLEVRSGVVSCWLNGTPLFTGEAMYTLSAGLFGLTAYFADLSNYQAGLSNYFIASVKAWSSSIPEPPNTYSGHGTYSAEYGYSYTDKYHRTGTYNPNA